jgi:hypothetical protein
MFGELIEIFRSYAVAADSGFPRKADIPLNQLMSITADLDVGAVAVEELISLGLLEQPVAVIAPARPLI